MASTLVKRMLKEFLSWVLPNSSKVWMFEVVNIVNVSVLDYILVDVKIL